MSRTVSLVGCFLGACSFPHGALGSHDGAIGEVDAADDAELIDAALGRWGPPSVVALAPPTNTDDDPSPTDDRLELYINSGRGGNADVYVSVRATTADAWSIPAVVPFLSGGF